MELEHQSKHVIGSLIDVQATLLIFINDVLQVPGEAYLFPGGSTIRFTEDLQNLEILVRLFSTEELEMLMLNL